MSYQLRLISQCLPETVTKMIKDNGPYINKVQYDNFILYEIDHAFESLENDQSIVIIVQENKRPYACQYHTFNYKGFDFEICESANYTVFRLE